MNNFSNIKVGTTIELMAQSGSKVVSIMICMSDAWTNRSTILGTLDLEQENVTSLYCGHREITPIFC